jgi:hypothetical protein
MLSIIGGLAASAVGTVPWAGPKTMLAALYACLIVMAVGGPATGVWLYMRGQMSAMEATVKAEWTAKLAIAENEYAERADAALLDAVRIAGPDNRADVIRMCGKSRACRDRGDTAR